MTEKFTKEPWEISDMSCHDAMDNYTVCFHIGVSSTGEMIADCQSDNKADYDRVKANAHLMKAAPEMYWVLQGICFEKSARICNYAPESCKVCAIRKALKKARGEE
mgnify:CR=1 FL=1